MPLIVHERLVFEDAACSRSTALSGKSALLDAMPPDDFAQTWTRAQHNELVTSGIGYFADQPASDRFRALFGYLLMVDLFEVPEVGSVRVTTKHEAGERCFEVTIGYARAHLPDMEMMRERIETALFKLNDALF